MATKTANGSKWRIWDLHIHTPESHLYNEFSSDWDSYVKGLFSKAIEKGIAAIGITDYFTIDGYKKLKHEYLDDEQKLKSLFTEDEVDKIKRILVLPNIEFRLDQFVGSNSINFHVIFSNEVSCQEIEESFLHDLDFVYEGNPQSTEEKYKLKISNLAALGKKLKEEHEHFKGNDVCVGMMNAVVNSVQISEVLENAPSKFKGRYLRGVVADEDLSKIDWNSRDHQTRKILVQKSDFLLTSNPKTREWALAKSPYTAGEEMFIKEFKTLKPCLHGSDAHTIDNIGKPCVLRGVKNHTCDGTSCQFRYTWIKADPTFEGLKQILYEPSDRIIIQQDNPAPIKSSYTLNHFKIEESTVGDELTINETNINLNAGLVAVTGGKGSGKTAFVDLIANCYKNRCSATDKNSFVKRVSDQEPIINTTVTFKDGESFSKSICDEVFCDSKGIVYIAQGELEEYIGDNSDLDVYIKDLIFESPQVKDTIKSYEFSEIAGNVQTIEGQILSKSNDIVQLEQQTTNELLQGLELDKKQKSAELLDIETRIQEFEKGQKDDKLEIAKSQQKIISDLKSRRDSLTNLKALLIEALAFLNNDISSFNSKLSAINKELKNLAINESYSLIDYTDKTKIETQIVKIKDEVAVIVKSIEGAQKELDKHETSVKDHAKLLDRKTELATSVNNLDAKLEKLKNDHKNLELICEQRKNLYKQLLENTVSLKKKYEEIIGEFSKQKVDVLSDLNFGAKITFDNEKYIQTAEDLMDNRKVLVNGKSEDSIFSKVVKLLKEIADDDDTKIEDLIEEIERIGGDCKDKIKSSKVITIIEFYKFLYGNYLSVVPTVKYKNTQLSKLSLGQKATVLIKIYLAQGDKPIIIDSHDDHLDNEFIMDELVKAIRQAKQYRQIILASNNGNVVINSDAEQIIIANRSDGHISYISGAIEDPLIRERAIKVLEGGAVAFRQRQQKYRIA